MTANPVTGTGPIVRLPGRPATLPAAPGPGSADTRALKPAAEAGSGGHDHGDQGHADEGGHGYAHHDQDHRASTHDLRPPGGATRDRLRGPRVPAGPTDSPLPSETTD